MILTIIIIKHAGDCTVGVADGVLSGMCVDDIGGVGDGFYAVVGMFVVVDLLALVVVVVAVVVAVVVDCCCCCCCCLQ